MQARNKTSIAMISPQRKTIWIRESYTVIIKTQEYIDWVSALSLVLFDSFINNLADGIENIFIKLAAT